MEHVVFFSDQAGMPAFERVGGLEEAVALVERLVNDAGVGDARIFGLTEVAVAVRTIYRVEVLAPPAPHGAPGDAPADVLAEVPAPRDAADVDDVLPAADVQDPELVGVAAGLAADGADDEAVDGEAPKGLGFFTS